MTNISVLQEMLVKAVEGHELDGTAQKWIEVPEGSHCRFCHSDQMFRSVHLIGGPYAGSVRCGECGMVESIYSYLGHLMVDVQPVASDEDLTIYEPDTDDDL